jgi:glycerophosphoryl diester phosphodiesterase
MELHLPEKYAPWLWGWPHRFLRRMQRADTRVILVAGDGDFFQGFDTPAASGPIGSTGLRRW